MDRVQLFFVGLPLFLFFSDLIHIFTPPPPPPPKQPHLYHQPHHHHPGHLAGAAPKNPEIGALGYGSIIDLKFCGSCSYKGTAVTMRKMLETAFPGIEVNLANYPPPLPKRLLGKLVPVAQIGVIGIVMAGDQIFPRLGFAAPPPWYFSLRANRFGSIATTWLLGNFLQSFLQSSGAFEVYFNGDLVFSKLQENRFPGELELQDMIRKRLSSPYL